MIKEKTEITKELVITQYKKSFINRYISTYIWTLIIYAIFAITLCLMAAKNLFSNPVAYYLIIMFSPFIMIFGYNTLKSIVELVKVLSGKFYITTDKIIEKREAGNARHAPNYPDFIKFETYGYYSLRKAFSILTKKYVSAKSQLNDAYLGDTYYVAIINHKKIIAIFSESCFCYNKDGKIS